MSVIKRLREIGDFELAKNYNKQDDEKINEVCELLANYRPISTSCPTSRSIYKDCFEFIYKFEDNGEVAHFMLKEETFNGFKRDGTNLLFAIYEVIPREVMKIVYEYKGGN